MYMHRVLPSLFRVTPAIAFPFLESRNKFDNNILEIQPDVPVTGWDAIKKMFSKNDLDERSIELHSVVQTTLSAAFFGACFGGFIKSKDAYLYFIENNEATIFKSTMQAKKKLQDAVTVAFARGAYHWGWRLGIFCGSFSLISTLISVYRGETSIIEYVVAGAVTGAIYKANLGLAASLVGAGLGAALSTVAGILIIGILKLTGLSMNDIRRALYSIKEFREYHYGQAKEKSATIKHDDLTKHHDMMVETIGEKTIEELV